MEYPEERRGKNNSNNELARGKRNNINTDSGNKTDDIPNTRRGETGENKQ